MIAKNTIINEALKLSEGDRLDVAQRLIESLEGPPDPDADQAWSAEIQRRLKSIDEGSACLVPWPKARQTIAGEGADGGASR